MEPCLLDNKKTLPSLAHFFFLSFLVFVAWFFFAKVIDRRATCGPFTLLVSSHYKPRISLSPELSQSDEIE